MGKGVGNNLGISGGGGEGFTGGNRASMGIG